MSCNFDKNGICFALACFSLTTECGARDTFGNVQYSDLEELREDILSDVINNEAIIRGMHEDKDLTKANI